MSKKMYYEELGYDFDPPFYRAEDKPVGRVMDDSWKTCDNCARRICHCENKNLWKPIPCPHCGGPLSELRKYRYGGGPIRAMARYDGKWYRHCYSCHAEFFVEE